MTTKPKKRGRKPKNSIIFDEAAQKIFQWFGENNFTVKENQSNTYPYPFWDFFGKNGEHWGGFTFLRFSSSEKIKPWWFIKDDYKMDFYALALKACLTDLSK
jgi:hypothetical protein